MFAGRRDSGEQVIPLRVVREAHDQFIHHLVFADGAGDRRYLCIFGDLVYEMFTVELADSFTSDAARHDRNAVHIRFRHHSLHSGVDVVIGKLSRYVPVEQLAEFKKLPSLGAPRTWGGQTHIGCRFLSNISIYIHMLLLLSLFAAARPSNGIYMSNLARCCFLVTSTT